MNKHRDNQQHTPPNDYHGIYLPNGSVTDFRLSPGVEYLADSEDITYENSRKTRMNPCVHQRYRKWPYHVDATYMDANGVNMHRQSAAESSTYLNDEYLTGGWDTHHPTDLVSGQKWQDLNSRAWRAIRSSLAYGAPQTANFLLELHQLKGLFRLWRPRLSTLKNLTNLKLNLAFGWSPFLSDISKIVSTFQRVGNRYAEVLEQASKVTVRHHASRLTDDHVAVPPSDIVSNGDGGYTALRYELDSNYSNRFTATARVCWNIPNTGTLAKIQGYLDAFGLRLDPSIPWNALPYSFVVDWFVDVGGWLEQFAVDNLKTEVVVLDYAVSAKFRTRGTLGRAFGPASEERPLWVATLDVYRRVPTSPGVYESVDTSLPDAEKLGLLAALAYQRINDTRLANLERFYWRGLSRQAKRDLNLMVTKVQRELRKGGHKKLPNLLQNIKSPRVGRR